MAIVPASQQSTTRAGSPAVSTEASSIEQAETVLKAEIPQVMFCASADGSAKMLTFRNAAPNWPMKAVLKKLKWENASGSGERP